MFEVPDWETDVPKTDVVFKKKATNKKFKNESAVSNPIYDFVKNPQCTTQSNTKPTVKDGSVSPKKKKPKKHKLNNVGEDDMSMKESEGFEFDELLVNAKIKKVNVIDIKDGCEELGENIHNLLLPSGLGVIEKQNMPGALPPGHTVKPAYGFEVLVYCNLRDELTDNLLLIPGLA